MKKVSIITINLNNKDGLRKTAESVVSQTAFSEIEWIVIDGGSSDGSVDVINEYHDKISYSVSEPDKGIYNAMNKGVAQAHGEYVLFVNSGDQLYEKNVIFNFINAKEFGAFDYCVGAVAWMKNGLEVGKWTPPTNVSAATFLKSIIAHAGEFIRRERFDKTIYDETYKIAADLKFIFNDIVNNRASYVSLPIVISAFDVDGISSDMGRNMVEVDRCIKEVLSPALYTDISSLVYGESLLTKIIVKLKKNDLIYIFLTLFACILYLPVWIYKSVKMKIRCIVRR